MPKSSISVPVHAVTPVSRRSLLERGLLGAAALAAASVLPPTIVRATGHLPDTGAIAPRPHPSHPLPPDYFRPVPPGELDPTEFLTRFDTGVVATDSQGRTVRTFSLVATDREIEVAPGVNFPAWTFNGQVPGPTLRVTEGDVLRVHLSNASAHAHTTHFHGTHPPGMDGVTPLVEPGRSFTYEFEVHPFGPFPYHCHVMPFKRHIHKGLYGALIVDPPGGRPPAREMVMIMNGFDTDFDGENEFYAVNTRPFHYLANPIRVRVNEPLRLYLLNMTEFDVINSFHLHASMFNLYRTGTSLANPELTDTVILGQGERAVLEFSLPYPGEYMFHAHVNEFSELGWLGVFEAV